MPDTFSSCTNGFAPYPASSQWGLAQSPPLTGKWTFRERLVSRGAAGPEREHDVAGSLVAFDYFEARGIPILAGRTFTAREYLTGDRRGLIINDVAARPFFPDGYAVGRELLLNDRPRDVVDVVKGTRDVRLDAPAEPQFYQPTFTGGSQAAIAACAPRAWRAASVSPALTLHSD